MRILSADYVHPISEKPIKNGVIVVDDNGSILSTDTKRADHDHDSLEIFEGHLIPGFVNAHCHLELSHMKGIAPTGTGLLPFLKTVVSLREFPENEIMAAISDADKRMYQNGIVAVGDISNKVDTAEIKNESRIRYYTFVESFDFMQNDLATATFEKSLEVFHSFTNSNGNKISCVPHAPYTVSEKLFELINRHNPSDHTVSIHNQETKHENDYFLQKSGDFVQFFKDFGFDNSKFSASGKSAIHYALENMDPNQRTLFVHNTMTDKSDILSAKEWSENIFWATCPNANLYIENQLPNYQHFLDTDATVCIGTDSLTSNWQLSILEELITIQKYQSYLDTETLLRWATLNGAKALGFEKDFGSFEKAKLRVLIFSAVLINQGILIYKTEFIKFYKRKVSYLLFIHIPLNAA